MKNSSAQFWTVLGCMQALFMLEWEAGVQARCPIFFDQIQLKWGRVFTQNISICPNNSGHKT